MSRYWRSLLILSFPLWVALLACEGQHEAAPARDGLTGDEEVRHRGEGPPFIAPGEVDRLWTALNFASERFGVGNPSAQIRDDISRRGRAAYDERIDAILGAADPAFLGAVRQLFLQDLGMSEGGHSLRHPDSGEKVEVNFSQPANLLTYLLQEDLPWTGALDASYCVEEKLGPGGALEDLRTTPCGGGVSGAGGAAHQPTVSDASCQHDAVFAHLHRAEAVLLPSLP